jgi:hypothetical protein
MAISIVIAVPIAISITVPIAISVPIAVIPIAVPGQWSCHLTCPKLDAEGDINELGPVETPVLFSRRLRLLNQ